MSVGVDGICGKAPNRTVTLCDDYPLPFNG
jgi:hypothetical protein